MERNTEALKLHAQEKTKIALEKTDKAIRELSLKGERINFNSVATVSGVSKAFLYSNDEVKERIELLRKQEVRKEINQRAKIDKTSKSKDIIIMAKDKKIRELENENKKLKEQLAILRGKLYSNV
ncbi:hypothetical protein CLHOM_22400 [Clostridium homopropionicum DSM 5847]|uniref:Transposase n=1 Tax=Clostridium homopropionicum DSM 5847 TaxID=1121318 RepID=A0A0L6Z8R8_9CLOT|nr:DUF6262 family protein [Clostridium homopropionicum]KOA19359.1 hypothetical protein CLHOM_22400 [Clostridium homopropionicum DSM 5847]SFG39605.1 hypothetical protein SAMN04488501_108173 [Clostridium homopropionicum]SFG70995.1 hypothetical protein SAMN04488501_1141 [Clostridium homopropionicum]